MRRAGALWEMQLNSTKSNVNRRPWFISVVAGVVTVVGFATVYRATHRPIPSQILQQAKALSVDPSQLNDLSQIDSKFFDKKPVTPDEWQRYAGYATGSNLVFKRKLARHLCAAQGSAFEASARAIIALDVKDPDPDTRANALISLHHLNDPAWRDVARQFLTDPAASPRKMAAVMLAQGAKVMQ